MIYKVGYTRRAQKQLDGLPANIRSAIYDAVVALAQNPRPPGCRKLHGEESWRIRVGDYRAIYDIDDPAGTVTVTRIAHRSTVYRIIFLFL
ncbi:MAG: type II toxin-antitoxin system RelE/ParE family toxin [Chloroflexota bacterium]|nr:type II toxin-antitoxin system RelE/ParE family toxin [Chloroflexota bacterium]